jgi:uncharacterized protein (TIGR04255 family)
MPFPESPRVVYRQNTLEEVICQLRFPTILKIEADPTLFQERVRADYPLYKEADVIAGPPLPPEIRSLLLRASMPTITRQFFSADEHCTLGLNREFLALSTTRYERWEMFQARLVDAVTALQELFAPAFYSRTGLRYRNVIKRSALNLEDRPWAELLAPHIAGELATNLVADVIDGAHNTVFRLDENGGQVRLQRALQKSENGELVYVIDADFFTEARTETANALAILDHFNRQARRLFRWCITPFLHEQLGPDPIR